jgi:macrocin-O-methyltransferase TylF-like protien
MSKADTRLVKAYKDILPQEIPDDRAYAEIFDKITPYTMTAREGLETTYALFQAVKYICQNKIAGDLVECGVWRGGSMMLISSAGRINKQGGMMGFGDTVEGVKANLMLTGYPERQMHFDRGRCITDHSGHIAAPHCERHSRDPRRTRRARSSQQKYG